MNRLLWRKLRRDLGRRRAQAAAVATSVMLGVAVFITISGVADDLRASYGETYERTRFADVWASGDAGAMRAALDGVAGVERTETRTSADIGATFTDRSITTRIVGFGPDTELNQLVAISGRVDLGGAGRDGGVVLERHAAEHFGLGPGDQIELAGHGPVEVIGVAASPEWLWVAPSQQEVVVDPDNFAVIFASEQLAAAVAPPGSTQVTVAVAGNDPTVADRVADALLAAGAVEVFTRASHPSDSALQLDIEGFEQLAAAMPLLFLGAAALSAGVLLARLIVQQRAEIGMLRANGYRPRVLAAHYSGYGVVIAAAGALVGVPLGIAGGQALSSAYAGFLGIPFVAHSFRPLAWLLGLAVALVVGAVAGAVPARAAARIDPAAAMRPGAASASGRRSVVERVLPSRAPTWLVMASRNLQRQPRRAATVGVGIVLSLVLCMTGLVLNDTIADVFDRQYETIDRRDLVVVFDQPASDRVLDQVAATPGVAVAEPHLQVPASAVAGDEIAPVQLQVFEPGTSLHEFDPGLPPGGLALVASTADKLGVGAGDRVELRSGSVRVPVEVASVLDEPLGGTGYLSTTAWSSAGGPAPTAVAVQLADRGAHRSVAGELSGLDGVVRVSDVVATAEAARELLAAATFFAALVLVLAVAMAGALIFNALTVTVGERETEVATLQANGVGRGWARRAITSENLLAVAVALVPGFAAGRLVAGWFVGQFSNDLFTLDPVLRGGSLGIALALIVVTALVAQVPGLRRLDRLDLAVKVRERSL